MDGAEPLRAERLFFLGGWRSVGAGRFLFYLTAAAFFNLGSSLKKNIVFFLKPLDRAGGQAL
jgi:hypothetical protein